MLDPFKLRSCYDRALLFVSFRFLFSISSTEIWITFLKNITVNWIPCLLLWFLPVAFSSAFPPFAFAFLIFSTFLPFKGTVKRFHKSGGLSSLGARRYLSMLRSRATSLISEDSSFIRWAHWDPYFLRSPRGIIVLDGPSKSIYISYFLFYDSLW